MPLRPIVTTATSEYVIIISSADLVFARAHDPDAANLHDPDSDGFCGIALGAKVYVRDMVARC